MSYFFRKQHLLKDGRAGRDADGDGIYDEGKDTAGGVRSAEYVAASEKLSSYVNVSTPLNFERIARINENRTKNNDELDKYGDPHGYGKSKLITLPVVGKGFNGVSEDEIRNAFSADKVSVYMAMSRATALKILGGDEIKNSLQTGKGTFKTAGYDRAVKEKEFLGVQADPTNPEAFPKYGFVGNKGEMSDAGIVGFGYGGVYLEFKDSIRERTTATIGDSYNGNTGPGYRIPAPLDAMGGEQFQHGGISSNNLERGFSEFKENPNNGNIRSLANASEYIEAQIYGKLSVADVGAVHVESKKDAAALEKLISKQGLDIKVVPTNTNTLLSKLNDGYIKEWHKVSTDDLDKLGDSYIKKGFSIVGESLLNKTWDDKRESMNLPETKKAVEAYRANKDLPVDVQRKIMREVIAESRKGPEGSLPSMFHRTPTSSQDGFTKDVFNEDLLREYPK